MFKLVDDAFWGDVTKAFPSATRVKTIAAEIFMMQKRVALCSIVVATTSSAVVGKLFSFLVGKEYDSVLQLSKFITSGINLRCV